jgi:cystathionine beta-synthase
VEALRGGDGALVVVDGRPAGIVTRADILAFLATGSRYDVGGPA